MKDYNRRMSVAGLGSLVFHVAIFLILAFAPRHTGLGPLPESEPLIFNLEPPAAEKVSRLIEPGAPATDPSDAADLISDRDTQAQDRSDETGDPERPALENEDEFDQLAEPAAEAGPPPSPPTGPSAPPSVPLAPTEQVANEQQPEVDASETPPLDEPPLETAEPLRDADVPSPTISPPSEEPPAPNTPTEAVPEPTSEPAPPESSKDATPPAIALPKPFDMAQGPPSPPAPSEDNDQSRGRKGGGVETEGFTSFKANEHELGAYMLQVRKKVERTWKTALRFKYSGTTATSALLECGIRPDGTLEFVTILEAGNSSTYAALCKEAVELAGPFGPFPFEVPEIYRSENLVVKWKFSFL